MAQGDVVEVVADIAAGQWGMFTTAQAEAAGVSRVEVSRLLGRNVVRRLRHGVYAMAGVPTDAFEDVRAEWLATDPERTAGERRADADPVVVSDETAASVLGIGDVVGGGVHFTAARRLQTRQPWVHLHRRQLSGAEFEWVGGLPVTTPRRTIEDLAQSGRWEQSHLRDLALDAVRAGLLAQRELAKSPVLARALPELAPPVGHAALRRRLANDARERGVDPREAYSTFFRMIFTAALMEGDGWVLKGGTGLLCRLKSARSTLDVDLFRLGVASSRALAALREAMDGRTVGRYTFRLGDAASGTGEGVEVLRVKVTAYDGTTAVESFNIDLSGDVVINAEPDVMWVSRGDRAVLAGYQASAQVRLYPVENQIADKLCAMYSHYGSGASTRYRDLYDVAMMVDELSINREVLAEALQAQQRLRGIALPTPLAEPAPGWAQSYNQQLRRARGAAGPFTTYETAMATVSSALSGLV
jgi:hypothetical protein